MRNPIAKLLRTDPDAEINRVRGRHAELVARLDGFVRAAECAASDRRALLIEGETLDDAALAKADAACRLADDRRSATEEAVREIASRLAEMEGSRAAVVDQAERDRVATELEARAQRIEKAAANLDRAAEKFFDVRAELIRVCNADAPLNVRQLATGEMPGPSIAYPAGYLAGILPHTEIDKIRGVPESAIGAAIPAMDALRHQAAAIREGSALPVLPAAPEANIPVVIPDESIVLSCPVTYHGKLGALQHIPAGGVTLPAPVAAAAREMGIGFDFDSADGRGILAAARRPGMGDGGIAYKRNPDGVWITDRGETDPETGKVLGRELYTAIPVNLHAFEEAERARLRAAA